MRPKASKLFTLVFLLIALSSFSQETAQTIRGRILDADTRTPLPGANVLIHDPKLGAVSDFDGYFRIENVPVGRINLRISFIGYEEVFLNNIQVNSARETVLEINMIESASTLEEVQVTDQPESGRVKDDMAIVSSRSISVEETKRFARAIDDPSRMVSSFAGVVNDPQGDNNIVVRGNSPRGVLWRLEGVEIPNPNHFSDEGGTGGPINALNSAMLANSDFYTGAFAPQYGNAMSAVMDMQLRQGNDEKREYSVQASTLGIDATVEGPFSSNYRGSYLANYRYSSLALLDAAGIVDFNGVPKYQDVSFKLDFPINRQHRITAFGLGGSSGIQTEETPEDNESLVLGKVDMKNRLGATGVTHTWLTNDKSYVKTSISANGNVAEFLYLEREDTINPFTEDYYEDFRQGTVSARSIFHYKLSKNDKFRLGGVYNSLYYNMKSRNLNEDNGQLETLLKDKGHSASIQGFVEWKHYFNPRLSMVSGVHYLHFALNNRSSFEPRAALQWEMNSEHGFSAGFGLHSRMESIAIYLAKNYDDIGGISTPNRNLGPARALHFVTGYQNRMISNTLLRIDLYYQHLFQVPVENEPDSYRSILNSSSGYTTADLTNQGTGRNFGVELTAERFFNRGFYYLGTLSLYRSFYTAMDGVERNTAFDGRYVVNALAGKEFQMGKSEKNRVFFINTKLAVIGGNPYTGLDLEASRNENTTVLDTDNPYAVRGDDVIKWDLALGIRRNHLKVTTEWKIDIQNLTNNQAVVNSYWQQSTQSIGYSYQLSMFPTLSYRISF